MKININAVLAHCIVLFSMLFTINVGIGAYFVYYKCIFGRNIFETIIYWNQL